MMPKIVVTQPIHEEVLARLMQVGEVVMNPGPEPWSEAELHRHLKDADAMMAFMPDRVDQRPATWAGRYVISQLHNCRSAVATCVLGGRLWRGALARPR